LTVAEAIKAVSAQLQVMADGKQYGSIEAAIKPGNNGPQIILTVKQILQ
jgi:hypothetical protein